MTITNLSPSSQEMPLDEGMGPAVQSSPDQKIQGLSVEILKNESTFLNVFKTAICDLTNLDSFVMDNLQEAFTHYLGNDANKALSDAKAGTNKELSEAIEKKVKENFKKMVIKVDGINLFKTNQDKMSVKLSDLFNKKGLWQKLRHLFQVFLTKLGIMKPDEGLIKDTSYQELVKALEAIGKASPEFLALFQQYLFVRFSLPILLALRIAVAKAGESFSSHSTDAANKDAPFVDLQVKEKRVDFGNIFKVKKDSTERHVDYTITLKGSYDFQNGLCTANLIIE